MAQWTEAERKEVAQAINGVRLHGEALKAAKKVLKDKCGVTSPALATKLITADILGNRDEVEAEIAAKIAAKGKADDDDDE